jgi:hypothetical protein
MRRQINMLAVPSALGWTVTLQLADAHYASDFAVPEDGLVEFWEPLLERDPAPQPYLS